MTVAVLRADARRLPLPDGSVDLVMCSPPYFGLRSYTDGGEHYEGQIGSEPTPAEWLAALVACTAEWVRVLKPEGSMFVNLGDTYAAGHGGSTTEGKGAKVRVRRAWAPNPRERPDLPDPPTSWSTREARVRNTVPGIPVKSLSGMPWRYALACIDDLGLILRAEIIWAKPNGLPESVTDRVRRSHEQVFHFTKQPRYFSAVDEIREPQAGVTGGSDRRPFASGNGHAHRSGNKDYDLYNPLGKLPSSVWEIPSQPLLVPARLGVDHFAAFPMELPRRVILGWSPAGVCTACNQGRRPVVDRAAVPHWKGGNTGYDGIGRGDLNGMSYGATERARFNYEATITGYACACPQPDAPTRPAVVVDPFGGTGTTALVASVNGRHGISVDLSMDYTRLAKWRTTDPGERARAMQVPKPPPVVDGQEALFPL